MYQCVNSRMDHVTYKAIGTNMMEYLSSLKLMFMVNVDVVDQCRLVITDSMSV